MPSTVNLQGPQPTSRCRRSACHSLHQLLSLAINHLCNLHWLVLQDAVDDAKKSSPYKDPKWPSRDECEEHNARRLEWDEYPATFLPAENKGFE